MDDLLKKELEFTKKFITDPSEINKENLLDIKLKIIKSLHTSDDANVKKVCSEYYDNHKKKIYDQYKYFCNLREYLIKRKHDTREITMIIDSTLNELESGIP
jgi:hypothetical protein